MMSSGDDSIFQSLWECIAGGCTGNYAGMSSQGTVAPL